MFSPRRPESLMCPAEFTEAGFSIERLVEPVPSPEMAQSHPERFAKLSTEPGFVLFRLVKPG